MKHCESVASLEKKLSRVVVDLVTDLNLGIKKKKSKWVLVFIVLFCFPQCGLLYFCMLCCAGDFVGENCNCDVMLS